MDHTRTGKINNASQKRATYYLKSKGRDRRGGH